MLPNSASSAFASLFGRNRALQAAHGETLFTGGGHYSLVNTVRGDIIHGGTVFPLTPVSNRRHSSALLDINTKFASSICLWANFP